MHEDGRGRPTAGPIDAWTWGYDGYDPEEEGRREALCATGNGYLTTRAAEPSTRADGVHYPGTYVAGVYDRRSAQVDGAAIDNESLVNLPTWAALTFRVDGEAWFHPDAADVLAWSQRFDLRRGVLVRQMTVRDDRGRRTDVTQRQFVSQRDRHLAALEYTVTPRDWSGTLEVRSVIEADVENRLVQRYRDLPGRHLEVVDVREAAPRVALVEVQTLQSHVRVAVAARTAVLDAPETGWRVVRGESCAGHVVTVRAEQGRPVTVEKVAAVYTSRDPATSEPAEEAVRWVARAGDVAALLDRHVLAWKHLWQDFDVSLDRPDAQRVLRLHLVHLLQTVSPNSIDLDAGIPARGLTGEAYRGHVLWDELFVLPVLTPRLPAVARAVLRYRHRRLDEARCLAREAGHIGAMFPWQSGSDGREESQQLHLNPESGRWIRDPTQRQRHVGLAVAVNAWRYYQTTRDEEFLVEAGAELVVEVARFFASIADFDRSAGRYVIRGVMGPDEFHTGYPDAPDDGVDNNAYTNVMTVWLLLRAREVLDLLPERARTTLTETLGLTPAEVAGWEHITRAMFVPFHDGVISQFEGYERLDELDWDRYRRRYGDIQRLDRILEAEGDSVTRYQASKQADVLMLLYLLSSEELRELLGRLGYELDRETIRRTIDYYLARTSHGSTLSALVHAWVLARSRRERAVDLFVQALESDVADIQGGTTPEGIHLAAMVGSVDLLQRCFSGLQTRGDRLVLDPFWPEELGVLEFRLRYREHPLQVRISGAGATVRSDPGSRPPVLVQCRDACVTLTPGSTVRFGAAPDDGEAACEPR